MIGAYQKDGALVADIARTARQMEGFRVWWLGQSGFLLQWQGHHLLLDPYLSDSLSIKYAHTDKPHTRVSERVCDPALLHLVDIATSSHNHTDHLDADTLRPLMMANPKLQLLIPEANRAFVAERLGCDPQWPLGISDDQPRQVGPFHFQAVPAAHNTIDRDEQGRLKYLGLVVSFGPYRVYHSGDTLWYDGMVELLRPLAVDVAFLPINGNRPERRVAGNLDYAEAAHLGREIGAKLTVPHHYDMFAFNTEDPTKFVAEALALGTPHRVMRLGEGIEVG
jgi:L-ascorbate metabolism protein UlaG (beta-lactamase superfamily)